MAPYEALYGQKYQSPLCWYESGEISVLGPDVIVETTENIKKIRAKILTAQSRQKSYADQRRKQLEFEMGEHIFLRVTPTTGIGRAIKTKKLNPRYIGPFEILRRFGPVAYQLRKYTSDAAHVLEPESVELKENLTFQVTPVRIDDTNVKKLRGNDVSLVKVAWERAVVEEHTWKLESEIQKDYPKLFSGDLIMCYIVDVGVESNEMRRKMWRNSASGSLFLVQSQTAAKEGLIMETCCLMLENHVYDGFEVAVGAAGKRDIPAMKIMIFDAYLMCI
ncbi:uncharacterized protein LOC107640734 [Arachis ipaensis]|uniref:uncharacterized protein LOC107640734 n=1 Tax=Arachis ipaensis TaxID=130454 RepID=UPI0007AF3387|nr:uncharacterized protein LOC107640734 [Arachis ipaensis]